LLLRRLETSMELSSLRSNESNTTEDIIGVATSEHNRAKHLTPYPQPIVRKARSQMNYSGYRSTSDYSEVRSYHLDMARLWTGQASDYREMQAGKKLSKNYPVVRR
jgi:hypothetical protein